MVGRFFKNNDKLGFILLPVAALLVWSFSFISPAFHTVKLSNTFLLGLIAPHVSVHFWMGLNLLTAIAGTYLLTFLCNRQEITEKQNLLPGFFFLIFSGLLNLNEAYHPLLAAGIPLIVAYYLLFGTYREELSLAHMFDAGFLLGFASLIYSPLCVFVFIPFISLLILKPFQLREWLLVIVGAALPFILCFTLLFLVDLRQVPKLLDYYKIPLVPFHVPLFGKGSFLIHTATILLALLGIYNSMFRSGNFKIKTKKVKQVLLWILLFGAGGIFFVNEDSFFKGLLVLIPLSVFIGDYLGNIKKNVLREFLTLLLLAAYVCSNLQAAGYL